MGIACINQIYEGLSKSNCTFSYYIPLTEPDLMCSYSCSYADTGCSAIKRWTKSKNPVIMIVIYHHQNPSESAIMWVLPIMLLFVSRAATAQYCKYIFIWFSRNYRNCYWTSNWLRGPDTGAQTNYKYCGSSYESASYFHFHLQFTVCSCNWSLTLHVPTTFCFWIVYFIFQLSEIILNCSKQVNLHNNCSNM
jgi:hypothetical protein